jgi:hypothetical protein
VKGGQFGKALKHGRGGGHFTSMTRGGEGERGEKQRNRLYRKLSENSFILLQPSEPEFVQVLVAPESISPAYVAWRAGTSNRVVVYGHARLGIESWAP